MQYYLNGFHTGDPRVVPVDERACAERADSREVDVLIVGSGPAGLVLAAQLARFPDITTHLVERRPGPLRLGRADGVACRTVEMMEAFGLSSELLQESYWVNETAFWAPACSDRDVIERVERVRDTEDGLSEFPHVILNQARMHDFLLDAMRRSATRLEPDYGVQFVGLSIDRDPDHPVEATLRTDDGTERVVRARYVVGCDGAHSAVRRSIGRELHGDVAGHAWGVMDILADTDFPDIRLKAAIQSADSGSILLIPREGGYLARLYVDLGEVDDGNRRRVRAMTAEDVVEVARHVLHPYSLEVAETAWFSIYEVAQRLTDGFDDAAGSDADPRVFIAGDACHTHSAKAGQGMNVSMQDAFNLGWKLASVLRGQSQPALLRTYSQERQPIAQELIDFDREWSAMMAAHPSDAAGSAGSSVALGDYYVRQGRYTAGVATHYPPGLLTGDATHQGLADGFVIGTRLHSWPVVRVADAYPTHLGHVARADGRWRLYLFADTTGERLEALCTWLTEADRSPVRRFTPPGTDPDSVFDVRAVLQRPHPEVDVRALPALLRPRKGRYGLLDHEKVFTASGAGTPDIYEARSIDRALGAAVLVRPDQYVAQVLPLDDTDSLASFFEAFLSEPVGAPA